MNAEWLKTRQTKFTAYVTVYVLIVIAVLGLLNWLAQQHNKSVDTTANKRFSLSDQTKKVVGELKQDVKITYFDKGENFTRAKDLLDRYDLLSTKLSVDYIDPDKKPEVATKMGVKTYGTIYVDSGPKHQEAKAITEEEITGALIRTLKSGDRLVCVVSGSGEHKLDETGRSGYAGAKEQMEKNNYKTREISLLEKPEVPKECTITLVAGPRFDYVPPVVDALKKYQEGGGKLLLFLDPPVKLGKEDIAENAALAKMIEDWGVALNKDLVLDTSGIGQVFGFSEVVPLVASYENHAITRTMKGTATAFPLARSLEVKGSAEKLFSTSENSFATTKLAASEIRIDPAKDKHGPFLLGAAGTVKAGETQSRFVVVGSSGWVANNILPFNGNKDLFLNMLNWLSADEELISIRPKDPEDRRLNMNASQVSLMFWTSVIGIPLLMLFAGVSVWWRRR